jgi:hypothetical protein
MREMKTHNIAIGTIFALGLSLFAYPAYAEEVIEETPAVESAPEYTPPPEASEGVGGWAVVNPETGNVHGVVVCTIGVCGPEGSWAGRMPIDYQGCGNNCVLRFQTRATADGNVAGWHGSDGSVRWNGDQNNFSINQQSGDSIYRATLVPERTARDAAGMDLHTGLIQRQSQNTTREGVRISQLQEDYLDEDIHTDILFPEWGQEGKLFSYVSEALARQGLERDVNENLLEEGYTAEDLDTQEVSVDEDNPFVQTVRRWTQGVIDFFRGIVS